VQQSDVRPATKRTWLWILAILVAIAAVYMLTSDSSQPDDMAQPAGVNPQ